MTDKQNIELLIVEYLDGHIKTYTLVKYNDYEESKPKVWRDDNVLDFKYVSMGKVRTKLIPYSAIKSAEYYEE